VSANNIRQRRAQSAERRVTMSRRSLRALRPALCALVLGTTMSACDWFTDFKSQPRIEPWEPMSQLDADTLHPPRGNPSFAVPVTGGAAPSYQISYKQLPQTLDSLGAIPNPTPVSPASLENGRKLFTINCAVCHGFTAKGDGPATKYGMPGINLTAEPALSRTDGYVFGMIRNGRGLMPTYNRIEEMDRWDVVNYLRALQGKVPNATGGTAPYGFPGQNGATVPGPSRTAPTRPAPMWRAALAAPAATPAAPVQGTPTDTGSAARVRRAADSAQTKRGTP
jgi:mono/diheme cytochrome c family protein